MSVNQAIHPDWLVPNWAAPATVRAVFTTRQGGVSSIPWDQMNLGDHVGDAEVDVAANRQLFQQAVGARAIFLKQVHGHEVALLEGGTPDGTAADACVTTQRSLACTIMVADCLPVLLATRDGLAVAAAHAGWRGLAGKDGNGVLETVLKKMRALAQEQSAPTAIKKVADKDLVAWLGPCIGPSAFEVGGEVKQAFEQSQPEAGRFFEAVAGGKFMCDLAGLARHRLQELGVTQIDGNDGSDAWCTASNPSKFFSHRRDTGLRGNGYGTTGRMAACVWIS